MPAKPEKYITISNKFKVYFYPIVFTVVIVLLFIASIIFLPNGLGSIMVGLYILIFVLGVVIPAYCIYYAKRVLTKEKHGFTFTFYNSTIITLSYVLPFLSDITDRYLYCLILFGWCELWTLIPWLKCKKHTNNSNKEI